MKYRRTAAAGVRRVEGLQHLDGVEGLPQGVRAREFPEGLENRGKDQEGYILGFVEGLPREVVVQVFK